jgi:TetR/AcrR family transcriptional regulator
MDELFLALFRRRAEQGMQAQAHALESAQPLWALWRFMTDPSATRLTLEFMGLANHRKALHAEIAHYAQRSREEQTKALTAVLQRYGVDFSQVPAVVWTFFGTGASQVLVFERSLGMTLGHEDILAFVEQQITALEGALQPDTAEASAPDPGSPGTD